MTSEQGEPFDPEVCSQSPPRAEAPIPGSKSAVTKPDPLFHWVLLLMAIGVLVGAVMLKVRGTEQVVLPLVEIPLPDVCTYKRLVGAECPGCGLTRCFISVAHGDVVRAWSFNPAGVFLFVVVVAQIPYRSLQVYRLQRGQAEIRLRRLALLTVWLLVVSLFLQWIVRGWHLPHMFSLF